MDNYAYQLAIKDVLPNAWGSYEEFKLHTTRVREKRGCKRWQWFRIVELHNGYYGNIPKKQVHDSKEFFMYLLQYTKEHFNGEMFVTRSSNFRNLKRDAQKIIVLNNIQEPIVFLFREKLLVK